MEEDWKTYSLGDVSSDISYGYTESASWEEIGPKFLRITDIQNDFISWEDVPYCKISEKDLIKYQVKIGDIVIARTGNSTGATSIIKTDINAVFASYLIRYRLNKELAHPPYVDFVLRSKTWANYVEAIKGGSAQPGANAKQFAEFEFLLPPLPEQRDIASILSALDDKIELNLQMNKTLEEMAMTLYKHWFVDFGPFKDGEFVSSELGEIPKGWEVKQIGQIVKVLGGYAFKSKDFIDEGEVVVKIKNISGNVVSVEGSDCIATSVAEKTNLKFIVNPGCFLIAMTGAEVGKVGVVPDYGKRLWLNQRVGMIIDPKFKHADILIGNYLQSEEGYGKIQNLAYGSAQPNISTTGIEEISLPIPIDISILDEMLNQIGGWHEQRIMNLTENQTLTTLRDTILPKLISGEVRVKDAARSLAEVL